MFYTWAQATPMMTVHIHSIGSLLLSTVVYENHKMLT